MRSARPPSTRRRTASYRLCLATMISSSALPRELELRIGRYRVWVTHGHTYYVSMGPERIMQEARERGMDVVMFGHTHRPFLERKPDLVALNPGSIAYPRQDGHRPSYGIMELDEAGEASYRIEYL